MWLPVCCNPWGVLFNPASIADALFRMNGPVCRSFPLVERGGVHYSFLHHGVFAGTDPETVSRHLAECEEEAHTAWQSSSHVLITFGSAWVYEREGCIVANCHRFPALEFVRRRLTVEEIVSLWQPIIADSVDKHFVFTVSPIRHLADGLHGNQLSKATLLLAIECLRELFPCQVDYLPIYELFMDDLRDYRFYADNLVHPGSLGIEAVKELVADNCFDHRLRDYVAEAQPIVKALQHRPTNPDSEQYKRFVEQQRKNKQQLIKKYENRR